MPYGAEYWAPQQASQRRPQMKIPRIEEYWTPEEAKMAAEEEMVRNIAARGPVARIGSHNRGTVIDLGAAAGIISDIVAAKKRAKMGAPAQARYQSAKQAYEYERDQQKAEEDAQDREIRRKQEERRLALWERGQGVDKSRTPYEDWRDQNPGKSPLDWEEAVGNVRGQNKMEFRIPPQPPAPHAPQFFEREGKTFRFDEKSGRAVEVPGMEGAKRIGVGRPEKNAADPNATALEKKWLVSATDPRSSGGINITENEKDALRQAQRQLQSVRGGSPGAATSQTVKGGGTVPKSAAPAAGFKTPHDVKTAVTSGKLSRDEAHKILKTQFGFTD